MRHPTELGGAAFSMSMIWAQIFPFVALQLFEGKDDGSGDGDGDTRDAVTMILVGSASLWVLLNVVFFCSINISYLDTFFSTKTTPQYTCELFHASKEDSAKFRAAFKNRSSYTTSIHKDVKKFVANNIVRWKKEKPDFFVIEKIPDVFLPTDVFEAEGAPGVAEAAQIYLN